MKFEYMSESTTEEKLMWTGLLLMPISLMLGVLISPTLGWFIVIIALIMLLSTLFVVYDEKGDGEK